MILNNLIRFFIAIVDFLISLFPVVDPVVLTNITTSITNIRTAFETASWLFPSNFTLTLLGIIISVEIVIFTVKAFTAIMKIITGPLPLGG